MSEGTEDPKNNEVSIEDLQLQLSELSKSNDSLKAKNEELLGETKKAKNAKRQVEADAQTAANEQARASGDHEQLYKSSEAAHGKTKVELEGLIQQIAGEKQSNAAMQIAAELADGDNAIILSDYIAKRLRFVDGGIKVTDVEGNLTVSSLEDLSGEFKNNSRYSALLKGIQSSGGGATGGSNSGGAAKTMTRTNFDSLNAIAAARYIKDGGSVTQ